MAVTVEVGLDLSANDPTAYFTLDDFSRGVLDNATYPLGGDEWVDVTDKVRSVRCTRGRSSSLGRFTAATGQVVLDNRDRAFDPSYAPTYVRDILSAATLWLDAQFSSSSQTVPNLGSGGSVLNGRLGSTVASDSNDPTFLAYDGTPYVYLPGVAGNSVTTTAPATTANYLATDTSGATTTAAASAGAFTFSTLGSWRSIALRNASNVVLTTVDFGNLTSGSATSIVGSGSETWTINRSTSGRKAVAVVAPCWLLGTDDYIEVPDNDLLDFGASDSFTVLAVVRQWATPANFGRFVAKRTGTSAGWQLLSAGTALQEQASIYDGTNTVQRFQQFTWASGSLNALGFRVDRSAQTLATFNNGSVSTTTSTSAAGSLANSEALRIGRLSGVDTGYQDFELVAVAVFRRALTAAEIAAVNDYYSTRTAIPGTATVDRIVAVMDGTGSPYYGSVVPRKPVRIKDGSDLIALLRAERWDLDYSLSGDSLAVLALADSLGDLATTTLPALPEPAEPTGTRIAAVLDAIDWPSDERDLDTGRARLAAATIADGTNAAAYLARVEASEPGALFVAKDGALTFRDRASLQDYSDGIAFGTDLPFTEPMSVSTGSDDLATRAIVVWSGGTATVDNTASQDRYKIISRTVDTLLESEDDAEALGTWIVNRDATPRLRVDSLTVHRHGLTTGQATSLHSLDVGSPVGVTWTPNDVGDAATQRAVVDQITHQVDAGGTRHTVTFALSPANAGFLLDDDDFGVLDTSALAF